MWILPHATASNAEGTVSDVEHRHTALTSIQNVVAVDSYYVITSQ